VSFLSQRGTPPDFHSILSVVSIKAAAPCLVVGCVSFGRPLCPPPYNARKLAKNGHAVENRAVMHMSEITDLLARMSADDRGARTLGVSTKTVNGDGLVARAWLRGEIAGRQ